MTTMSPRMSKIVDTMAQVMARRDALAALCMSPTCQADWTRRELLSATRAHGKPMIRLNSTPQTMHVIAQAR